MTRRTASCSCGQLSITVQGDPEVGVCHCLACQKRTGSVFAALAAFPPPWTVTGQATDYVSTSDRGASYRFRFCSVCGTTLFTTEADRESYVGVSVGAFADPGFPPPTVALYDCRRHGWVTLPEGITTFETDSD